MTDWLDDDDETTIHLDQNAYAALEVVRKRMCHASIADTIKHALGLYDMVTMRNMGPGQVHVGVLSIDDVPSEQFAIVLR